MSNTTKLKKPTPPAPTPEGGMPVEAVVEEKAMSNFVRVIVLEQDKEGRMSFKYGKPSRVDFEEGFETILEGASPAVTMARVIDTIMPLASRGILD